MEVLRRMKMDIKRFQKFNKRFIFRKTLSIADPDPGSGALLTLGSGIRKGKKSGFGMNIPDHFSESLETVFRVINTKILWYGSDPGSEMEKLGSGINIPDPQH